MHRSRSILVVSTFSTVSVLSFDPSRVRALCVEEPYLGGISSDSSNSPQNYLSKTTLQKLFKSVKVTLKLCEVKVPFNVSISALEQTHKMQV